MRAITGATRTGTNARASPRRPRRKTRAMAAPNLSDSTAGEESSNAHVHAQQARRRSRRWTPLANDFADVAMDGLIDEFVGWSVGGLMAATTCSPPRLIEPRALSRCYKGHTSHAPGQLAEKQHIKRRLRSFDNHVAACAEEGDQGGQEAPPAPLPPAGARGAAVDIEQSGAGQHGAQRGPRERRDT